MKAKNNNYHVRLFIFNSGRIPFLYIHVDPFCRSIASLPIMPQVRLYWSCDLLPNIQLNLKVRQDSLFNQTLFFR